MTLKLHLGCGKRDFGNDWDHIDISKEHRHIKSHDIINLPYNENSVDLIYASHVFEYFDRSEAVEVLEKWKKVLKPGGIFVFTCATTGRPEHGTVRTTPHLSPKTDGEWAHYYKNLTQDDIRNAIDVDSIFSDYEFEGSHIGSMHDLYFYGIKKYQ